MIKIHVCSEPAGLGPFCHKIFGGTNGGYERLAGTQVVPKKCLCDRKDSREENEPRYVILCTRYRESNGQRTADPPAAVNSVNSLNPAYGPLDGGVLVCCGLVLLKSIK